jgi:hypothetical protein
MIKKQSQEMVRKRFLYIISVAEMKFCTWYFSRVLTIMFFLFKLVGDGFSPLAIKGSHCL